MKQRTSKFFCNSFGFPEYEYHGTPLDDMRKNDGNCVFCGEKTITLGQAIVKIYCPKCGFIYYEGLS